jgi:hypothetical protein
MFDRSAVYQVFLYYDGHVAFRDAEVPGAARVDDEVRAVLAEAEAVHGVYADVPVHAMCSQFALQRAADFFRPALFAVAALADQNVGVVFADLRVGLIEDRERAAFLCPLLRLLALLRDGSLRF